MLINPPTSSSASAQKASSQNSQPRPRIDRSHSRGHFDTELKAQATPEEYNTWLFHKEYNGYHDIKGLQHLRPSVMRNKEVDLCKLYTVAMRRGGFEQVTQNKLWKEVYNDLNDVTNASTNVSYYTRLAYERHLLAFENFQVQHGSSPENPLVEAVEAAWAHLRETLTPEEFEARMNQKQRKAPKSTRKSTPRTKKETDFGLPATPRSSCEMVKIKSHRPAKQPKLEKPPALVKPTPINQKPNSILTDTTNLEGNPFFEKSCLVSMSLIFRVRCCFTRC